MLIYLLYRKKVFGITFSLLILFCGLLILCIVGHAAKPLIFLMLFLTLVPLLLLKPLMSKNTKKAIVSIDANELSIAIRNLQNDTLEKNEELRLNDIKSYTIKNPNSKFCAIKFRLLNNQTKEFSFWNKKFNDDNDEVPADEIIDKIHFYLSNNADHTIELKPAFMATLGGLIVIILLILGELLTCLLFLRGNHKALPGSIVISVLIIVQLIIQRYNDKSAYKKMKAKNQLND